MSRFSDRGEDANRESPSHSPSQSPSRSLPFSGRWRSAPSAKPSVSAGEFRSVVEYAHRSEVATAVHRRVSAAPLAEHATAATAISVPSVSVAFVVGHGAPKNPGWVPNAQVPAPRRSRSYSNLLPSDYDEDSARERRATHTGAFDIPMLSVSEHASDYGSDESDGDGDDPVMTGMTLLDLCSYRQKGLFSQDEFTLLKGKLLNAVGWGK
jgi:hypothetical protein